MIFNFVALSVLLGIGLATGPGPSFIFPRFSDCGGNLIGETGTILSPNYPSRYPYNARCVWTITTDPGTRIRLRFSSFSVENGPGCGHDSLKVRDGSDSSASIIMNLCGYHTPDDITSTGNAIYLQFTSDRSVNNEGFIINWSSDHQNLTVPTPSYSIGSENFTMPPSIHSTYCGGNLVGDTGSVESPDYPRNYPSGARCVWTITTDPGMRVRLSFNSFALENYSDCRYDSLVIHDGDSSSSTILANLCGASIPGPFVSSGNTMYLEFKSDTSISAQGFTADWVSVNISYEEPAVGTTSGYSYTESAATTEYDFSQLFNLSSTVSPYFQNISYSNVSTSFGSENFTMPPSIHSTHCGGNLVGDTGSVESPDYPRNYPSGARCVWTITTDPGMRVRLSFNSFALENYSDCRYDSLVIHDGDSSSSTILANLCGASIPGPFVSSGNTMYLEFKSDTSISAQGFTADWVSVNSSYEEPAVGTTSGYSYTESAATTEYDFSQLSNLSSTVSPYFQNISYSNVSTSFDCSEDLVGNNGTILSPNYPGSIPHSANCVWTITSDPGTRVVLVFLSFSMEGGHNCPFDSLTIRDGNSASSDLLHTLCSTSLPPRVVSTGNELYLELKTDGSVTSRGFNARWETEEVSGEQN